MDCTALIMIATIILIMLIIECICKANEITDGIEDGLRVYTCKDDITEGDICISIRDNSEEQVTGMGKFKTEYGDWVDVVICTGIDRYTKQPMAFVRTIDSFCKDLKKKEV